MKILRLLNKKNFLIIIILFFTCITFAEEQPVDIWNLEKEKKEENTISEETVVNNDSEQTIMNSEKSIYDMQSQKNTDLIKLETSLEAKKIEIFGLYDPEDYDLDINMWQNSNGNQIKKIFSRLKKIDLSEDATELMNITLLTNAHSPKIDISENEWVIYDAEVLIDNSKKSFEKFYYNTNFDYHIIKNLFSNLSSLSFLELIELRKNYNQLNY